MKATEHNINFVVSSQERDKNTTKQPTSTERYFGKYKNKLICYTVIAFWHDTRHDVWRTTWHDMTWHGMAYDTIYDIIRYMIYTIYDVIYDIWCDTRYTIWYNMIYDTIYDIRYDTIYDMIWYDMIYDTIWYDMIYDMIWYICQLQLGCHPVAAVQYTFTHKQYTEQHNQFRNSAGRALSLRVIPCHLAYSWGKKHRKVAKKCQLARWKQNIQTRTFILCYAWEIWTLVYKLEGKTFKYRNWLLETRCKKSPD